MLEDARPEFLDILYKNNCIRSQKKQKVFFWYSVNHERLFQEALERDRKRESLVHPGPFSCTQFEALLSSQLSSAAATVWECSFLCFCCRESIHSAAPALSAAPTAQGTVFANVITVAGTIDPLNLYFAQGDHHHMHAPIAESSFSAAMVFPCISLFVRSW